MYSITYTLNHELRKFSHDSRFRSESIAPSFSRTLRDINTFRMAENYLKKPSAIFSVPTRTSTLSAFPGSITKNFSMHPRASEEKLVFCTLPVPLQILHQGELSEEHQLFCDFPASAIKSFSMHTRS